MKNEYQEMARLIFMLAAGGLYENPAYTSEGIPLPPRSRCRYSPSYRVKLKDKRRKP